MLSGANIYSNELLCFLFHFLFCKCGEPCELSIAARIRHAEDPSTAKVRQIRIDADRIHQALQYRQENLLCVTLAFGTANGRFMTDEFVYPCLIGRGQVFEIGFNVAAKRVKIHARAMDLGFQLVVGEAAGKGRRPAHSGPLRNQFGK